MKYDNQLRYALKILEEFQNQMPLNAWLKNYFRLNKQMGSKDRRQIAEMIYAYYRLGHAKPDISKDERIFLGLWLCNREPMDLLAHFKPEWNNRINLSAEQKISSFNPEDIFPWKNLLSEGIDHRKWCLSFLQQPDLFIRIRPGKEDFVIQKMNEQGWAYEKIASSTLRLPTRSKIEDLFNLNTDIVVQDLNSQRVSEFFPNIYELRPAPDHQVKVWDCCAGSGGKTMLLYDHLPGISITVSDKRDSILVNLKKRLSQAGIEHIKIQSADLSDSKSSASISGAPFDMILADVPCSGSGTWARNPESLYFFNPKNIEPFHSLQKKILTHILPHLKKGAQLMYITCSVFKEENEEITHFLKNQLGMNLITQKLLTGYTHRADTMFVSRAGG